MDHVFDPESLQDDAVQRDEGDTLPPKAEAQESPDRATGVSEILVSKNFAIAAAVTLGLAGVLVASWPGGDAQAPDDPAGVPIAASAGRALPPFLDLNHSVPSANPAQMAAAAQMQAGQNAGADLSPGEQGILSSDAIAAATSLMGWFGPEDAAPAEVALPQDGSPLEIATLALSSAAGPASVPAPAASPISVRPVVRAAAPLSPVQAPASLAIVNTVNIPPAMLTRATMSTPAKIPAQWVSGGPVDSDNRGGRFRGSVVVKFTVQPDGSASDCSPVRPSGNSKLDALTCRIVEERARFTPALDAQHRYVASDAQATYVWGRGRRFDQ